jgi:acyl carrier protein
MTEATAAGIRTEEVERQVVGWVTEMMGEDVSAEDNFLDVGGHSMLALELNRKTQDEYGAEFDLKVLFESSLSEATADLVQRATAR